MSADGVRLILGWFAETLADGAAQFAGAIDQSVGPWGGAVLVACGFLILGMCAGLIIYLYRHTCCRLPAAAAAAASDSPQDAAEKGAAKFQVNGKKKKSPLEPAFTVEGDLPLGDLSLTDLPLGDVSYWSWARGSMYDTGSLAGEVEETVGKDAGSSVRDSSYSTMSDTSSLTTISSGRASLDGDGNGAIPRQNGIGGAVPRGAPPPPATPKPMLSLRIHYTPESNQLTLTARGVRSLPNRDYGSSPSPQLHVTIERTRWPQMMRSPQLIEQLSTAVARRTRNPNWEHTFTLNVTEKELKDWQAHFHVWDDCKLQGSRIIGEVMVVLKRHLEQLLSGGPTQLQLPLAPREQQRGFLLFGLSYLPTSQRLSVTVVQGVRLRWQLVAATLEEFRPHIRATLVSPSYGKVMCKNRLEAKEGRENMEFAGTMMLDLTSHELATASLVVAVCFKPASTCGGEKPKSRILGTVSVGTQVATSRGREHWWAVAHCPRRVVSIWHALR